LFLPYSELVEGWGRLGWGQMTIFKTRKLRKNMTEAERILWSQLRGKKLKGYKFRRQHKIGEYITDFTCIEGKLVVELDGFDHIHDGNYDLKRTNFVESKGYKLIRFWNGEVEKQLGQVLFKIRENL
jgi:leucyl-tRNA synthetase